MSRYDQGRRIEWAIMDDLRASGYVVVRAAGSKGPADIVAIKEGQVLFVSVKKQRPPSPRERADLIAISRHLPQVGLAIVAMAPPGKGLTYRRLITAATNGHTQWSPDYA